MFFFFSSRRRHTRYIGDWSSDVCSSDLFARGACRFRSRRHWRMMRRVVGARTEERHMANGESRSVPILMVAVVVVGLMAAGGLGFRSEERRVGKEGRGGGGRGCGRRGDR